MTPERTGERDFIFEYQRKASPDLLEARRGPARARGTKPGLAPHIWERGQAGIWGKRPRLRRSPQLLQRLLARAHPGSPAPGDHAHSLQCKMEARARRGLQGPAGRLETRRAQGWEALPRGSARTPVTSPTTYRASSASKAGIPAGLQRRHPHAAALPSQGVCGGDQIPVFSRPCLARLCGRDPRRPRPLTPPLFRDQSRRSVWKISQ